MNMVLHKQKKMRFRSTYEGIIGLAGWREGRSEHVLRLLRGILYTDGTAPEVTDCKRY